MTDAPMPHNITIGDKYGPAMAITDADEARAYFERCVEHSMKFGGYDRTEAEVVERMNLGYYAGYYGPETAERVYRLYGASHPIFGRDRPEPEVALATGRILAREGRP